MEFSGYTELFDSFVFRKEGALTIPKSVRSKAFSMQINVEIISVAKNIYRNFASLPPYGFYGYAVIVFRNYAQVQIPLNQARQVIYYDRNDSAFSQWYSLYLAQIQTANLLAVSANQIVPIGNALGVIFTPSPTECISAPVWEELPIREVYVNTQFGTTFRIEVFHTLPVATEYGSCFYDGGSQFNDDPIKDSGLPSTGTQPQIAEDANNPYQGFPEPSTEGELGDFFNDKLGSIDEPNSENEPNPLKRWAFLEGQFKVFSSGCSINTFGSSFEISPSDATVIPTIRAGFPISDSCGGQLVIADIIGSTTGNNYGTVGGDGTYVATYADSDTNPFVNYP